MNTPFVEDPFLPAAPYLTGPHAGDILEPAVVAAGGTLHHASPHQVIYRPGRDLTVMFRASISWAGHAPVDETLVAGIVQGADLPGTVPIEADGLRVHVWRYPFDPMLPGLVDAVTDQRAAALLGVGAQDIRLQVVSFRPGRRAVVRVQQRAGDDLYLKVVPLTEIEGLVARHAALRAAGLPVPEVTMVQEALGLVAVKALPGRDLRTVLATPGAPLPSAAQLVDVLNGFGSVSLPGASPVLPLLTAAPRHAAMLRLVHPSAGELLESVLTTIAADRRVSPATTIHGDLHDGQLRIDDRGDIVGVLDVDGAGPGDPLDDLARLAAHVRAVALLGDGLRLSPGDASVDAQARRLHAELRGGCDDPDAFDRRVAAALIGLATGPYRAQSDGWQERTIEVLSAARQLLEE